MNRERFFLPLKDRFKDPDEFRLLQLAYWLAKTEHRLQYRDSGERYFEHAREVCLILIEFGAAEPLVLVLAFLHDLLEDCWTPEEVILKLFGPEVYGWSKALSKKWASLDLVTGRLHRFRRPDAEYYAGIAAAPREPRLVKLADRIHNLRSSEVWHPDKRLNYVLETREHLLPVALATDPRLHAELAALCARIETEVGAAVL